jgi:hypothetical protein
MKVWPMGTKGKGKDYRFTIMQPWLEYGQVRVSDAETPFLNELRNELNLYPNCRYKDALDALYWALMGVQDVLSRTDEDELPEFIPKKKVSNIFAEMSNWRG